MLASIPTSVYRLQFNEHFTFKQALALLPYLEELGIEGIYASPIFEAASSNGYDITHPNKLNPLLGTQEEWEQFCAALKQKGFKLIIDVIPNHMGIKGNNSWWLDVLKNGPDSIYSDFFDIDWYPQKKELQNKVLLPILANFYGEELLNQEIQVVQENGDYWIQYKDFKLPLTTATYPLITETINGKKGDSKSFDALHNLLEKQYYRLAQWQVAGQEINYRRFFNINELIAIHIEKEVVLNAHHAWVFSLLKEGKVQGLRIDHPDGLYNPTEYFERIQQKKPPLLIVEKILDFKEELPGEWQVNGTSGYDFLNVLNALFIEKENERLFTQIYEAFINQSGSDFEALLYERKKWFLTMHAYSEINTLGWKLDRLSETNRYYRDFTRIDLTRALQEVIACFPVYRTYIVKEKPVSSRDEAVIKTAIEKAKQKAREIDLRIFSYMEDLLLKKLKHPFQNEDLHDFILRFQQLTAPVMAKGLEDSVFYIFNRFISLNEVGGDPLNFGISKQQFHDFNTLKQKKWPLGFLATSTHDTKRSFDVHMRLNVLSEIPQEWQKAVMSWKEINTFSKPDPNTEYFIYQTLVGIWPCEPERLWASILKSVREAGLFTSWHSPDVEYEKNLKAFVFSLFESPFLAHFETFKEKVAHYGTLNSLAAIILTIGSCGIVDIYQGSEDWKFTLMDPDNRQTVDYEALQKHLSSPSSKIHIVSQALQFRKKHKELFLQGEYLPLTVHNARKDNCVAFLRKTAKERVLVAAGRFFTQLATPPLAAAWEDTFLNLPPEINGKQLTDIFTGKTFLGNKKGELPLSVLFEAQPYTILHIQ